MARDPDDLVPLEIIFEHDPTVNFAMQQNEVPVVKDLRVRNLGEAPVDDVLVRVRCEPEFAAPWERRIERIPPGLSADLNPVDPDLATGFLFDLSERLKGVIHVEVLAGGAIVAQRSEPISVLACDEWNGVSSLPEILAAFVLPNHPAVETILGQAASILGEWSGDTSLSGYHSKDRKRAYDIAGAIFTALHRQGINYINPPASFEVEGQKVRLPHRILEKRLGTCLDLAVLCAACLEQAGLFPLVIFKEGHAFCGAWLIEECFPECAVDDPLRLRKRLELGELCVFEATMLTQPPATFDLAVKEGRRQLDDLEHFRLAIDIQRARKSRIRPLPLRGQDITLDAAFSVPELTTAPGAAPDFGTLGTSATARPLEAQPVETAATRLDKWKRKLLDLSLNNRLLNFRATKKTLRLLCPDLPVLEDALADGKEFKIFPRLPEMDLQQPRSAQLYTAHTGQNAVEETLREELGARRLHADVPEDKIEANLLEIYRSAQLSLEEGGANTLYLALGFLAWYETTSSNARRTAPIILIPMELDRLSVQEGFRLRLGDDEPRLNITLLEKLKADWGISVEAIDPIPEDEHGIDVVGILTASRRAVRDIPRWEVVEEAQLGHFSFTKFLMWRDLSVRSGDLERNAVVKHLIHTPNDPFRQEGEFPRPERLDEDFRPEETYCPLPSDSSQLAAVYAAASDKSFVLEGPPGTGKSQTITNMIAHSLATGKTVLFVSEKMAALNVVHRRLTQYGLGPFCLQIHSNKTHKTEVLQQMKEALDQKGGRSRDEWLAEARRLADLRADLNRYVEALHRRRSIGRSVFQGISMLIGRREYPCVPLSWDSPDALTPEDVHHLRDAVDRLRVAGEACDPVGTHPWRAVRRTDYGPSLQHEVEALLDQLAERQTTLRDRTRRLAEAVHVEARAWSVDELALLRETTDALRDGARMPRELLVASDWSDVQRLVDRWLEHGRKRDTLRGWIYSRYSDALLRLDLDNLDQRLNVADQSWAVLRWLRRRGIRKVLQMTAKPGTKIKSANLAEDIEMAKSLRGEEAVIAEAGGRGGSLLGSLWNEGAADWAETERFTALSGRLRDLASRLCSRNGERAAQMRECWADLLSEQADRLGDGGDVGKLFNAYREAVGAMRETRGQLKAALSLDAIAAWGEESAPGALDRLRDHIESWKANLTALRRWCHYRAARQAAVDARLSALVEAYEEETIRNADLVPSFERSFYQWWTETVIESEPVLRSFASREHERKLAQFHEIDERYMHLVRDEVHARLAAKVPASEGRVSENSEVGVLRRQIQMKRKQLPVRTLFQRVPTLLPRLKPCLLMSPLSVAQYLDPAYPPFDLVIFDEASQMPVWDAVGAIARGKELIVVGDPKQLPPTNFFSRQEDDEPDEDVVQDMESILDDCISAQLPLRRLQWHYRSRHESLIAFSNHRYYENELLTFPSPHLDSAVKLRPVPEGVYDKGNTRTNRAEAEAIVEEIVARLSDPERSQLTLGVVTFSQAQQTLIEDLLEEARRDHPGIDPFFNKDAVEPVFVKNLENVQGDERDVILFSICYGPDEQGRVAMNFGPLNREGGQRRLNVAVTRARYEVVVFSTLRADQINLSRTRAAGARDLKLYLEYAERGPRALASTTVVPEDDSFESLFEMDVCTALRERGYEVHTQVGCSGYRIDLGVVDPTAPGRYLLGVECDGANYHRAKTARDRDCVREQVLRGLGWNLFRIWSTDWWEAPNEVMERLENALRAARSREQRSVDPSTPRKIASLSSVVPSETSKPKAPAASPIAGVGAKAVKGASSTDDRAANEPKVYHPFVLKRKTRRPEKFYEPGEIPSLRDLLEMVVRDEGPISLSLAGRRLVAAYGMERVGSVIQEHLKWLVVQAQVHAVEHGEATFLWPPDVPPESYRQFRTQSDSADSRRSAEDLPPEEIANAAEYVLRRQLSLPLDDLVKETARAMGYQRTGKALDQYLRNGVDLMLAEERATLANGNVSLKE